LLAFSFAPFESKEKADKKYICFCGERCFLRHLTLLTTFLFGTKGAKRKVSKRETPF
jgi:hypothetical protein